VSALSLPYRIVLGRRDLLPLCDVYLLGPKKRALVPALIDSGAMYSVFHVGAAEEAGLALSKAVESPVQFGGSISLGWRMRAHLVLEGRRLDTEVIFVEKIDLPYGLLGRRGVFGQFNEVVFLERVGTPRVEFRW